MLRIKIELRQYEGLRGEPGQCSESDAAHELRRIAALASETRGLELLLAHYKGRTQEIKNRHGEVCGFVSVERISSQSELERDERDRAAQEHAKALAEHQEQHERFASDAADHNCGECY